jgi:WD40 repeat protein
VPEEIPKNSLKFTRFKGRVYDDVKYLPSHKYFLACTYVEGEMSGQVDMIDLQRRKTSQRLVLKHYRIYNMELSKCETHVFINLDISRIQVYNTSTFELKYEFLGYFQHDYLMRMSMGGGKNNNLLAVSSEDAEVCIFDTTNNKLTTKIKSVSGKPVNCVRWSGKDLYFGCDGGNF